MKLFGFDVRRVRSARAGSPEVRSSLENPSVSLSDAAAWRAVFGSFHSRAGVDVTAERAMGVAAYWCGVAFLSGTIASVPLYLYRLTEKGAVKADRAPLFSLLSEAPNEETSSFNWRQTAMVGLLQDGRSYSLIERSKGGQVKNLWSLEYSKMEVRRKDGRKTYVYSDGGKITHYTASQILDLVWVPRPDGLGHYNPIETLKDVFGVTIATNDYAAKFFQNGGVPPLQLVGPLNSPDAVRRAATDLKAAVKAAQEEERGILPMPAMHELKPIGIDPEKGQMMESRRFQLEEMARVLQLPPVFLQDLTHGTFSNTEQQDLHLVKHTVRQWFRRWEDELNLKLVAARSRTTRIRFDEDELLRGDFKTRMEGYAKAVQNALVSPDEGREAMGWPRRGGDANKLHIQGATVPLGMQPMKPTSAAKPEGSQPGDESPGGEESEEGNGN